MLNYFFHSDPTLLYTRLRTGGIEWESVVRSATRHEVLPGLSERAQSQSTISNVPRELLHLAQLCESLNAERNQHILSDALQVTQLLNQIDIHPVALKGLAYLLTNTYSNLGSRYLLDVDLLIPAHQLSRAITHLIDNGFIPSRHDPFIQFRHHAPELRRPNGPAFELHHQVGMGICNRLLPAAQLFAGATPALVPQTQNQNRESLHLLVPSPTNLVNHLILHSQLAHPYHERIFPPLRALVDLKHLQTRFGDQIDWAALVHTYRANGQYSTLVLHLLQAQATLGLALPFPFRFTPSLHLRWARRRILNAHPFLRFVDPIYLFMSFFSRRARLVPRMLRTPSAWIQIVRTLSSRIFLSCTGNVPDEINGRRVESE